MLPKRKLSTTILCLGLLVMTLVAPVNAAPVESRAHCQQLVAQMSMQAEMQLADSPAVSATEHCAEQAMSAQQLMELCQDNCVEPTCCSVTAMPLALFTHHLALPARLENPPLATSSAVISLNSCPPKRPPKA